MAATRLTQRLHVRWAVGPFGLGSAPQSSVLQNLAAKGLTLPTPNSPIGNYVPAVVSGGLLFLSGQIAGSTHPGQLGTSVSIEQAQEAARQCVLNGLAQAQKAIGDLEAIERVLRVTVFVNAAPSFTDHPKVGNGASDTLVAAFGAKGRHVRSAVGVASLPLGACVEVEMTFQLAPGTKDLTAQN